MPHTAQPTQTRVPATPEDRYRSTKLWALRLGIAVAAIVIAAVVLNVLGVLAPVIEFLAVGSLVAFIAAPVVNFLEHRRVPRGLGAFAGLLLVIAVVVLVIAVILPTFTAQIMEILTRLPANLRSLQGWLNTMASSFNALADSEWRDQINVGLDSLTRFATDYVGDIAGDIGQGVMPLIGNFASTLFICFLGLVLAYWLARDYPRIHNEICTILGDDKEEDYRLMIAILSRSVGGYMRSMCITSVINGVLVGVGLVLCGHPYAVLMGVLTGVLHLIPVVGPWISAAIATLIALFVNPIMAFWTLVITMVAQNITDNVISPKIMQSTVSVHPVMSLTAIIVGSALLGPLGMVIAIPLSAALKGLFIYYFESRTGRQLVSYEGAIFQGTPYLDASGHPVSAFDALGDDSFATSELISKESVPDAQAAPKPDPDDTLAWSVFPGAQFNPATGWRLTLKDRVPEVAKPQGPAADAADRAASKDSGAGSGKDADAGTAPSDEKDAPHDAGAR